MLKLGYNIDDGHISSGERSHAEQIRSAGEWDRTVRAIVFPETKAVYFRFFAPEWDGISRPTEEDVCFAHAAADNAACAFIKAGFIRASWHCYHWETDEKRVKSFDVRV